jgi:hypothetical protein
VSVPDELELALELELVAGVADQLPESSDSSDSLARYRVVDCCPDSSLVVVTFAVVVVAVAVVAAVAARKPERLRRAAALSAPATCRARRAGWRRLGTLVGSGIGKLLSDQSVRTSPSSRIHVRPPVESRENQVRSHVDGAGVLRRSHHRPVGFDA